MLFNETINGWESWGAVFCSTEAFAPLAEGIFKREGLTVAEGIQNLTPGSNAVFKGDNLVIKIFAPIESGVDTEQDFLTELTVMEFAMSAGISVPRVIAYGEIADAYLFRYIIMEYVAADVPVDELLSFSTAQKQAFVRRLKQITSCLNHPFHGLPSVDLRNSDVKSRRMKGLDPGLIDELSLLAQAQEFSDMVLVHGDITRDNIIISSDGRITLIDFADCIVAPVYYELPAIIFELFLLDTEMVRMYVGSSDMDEFLDRLIKGLSVHMFCGFVLKDYFSRSDLPWESVKSIDQLKKILRKQLSMN